jgi:hypothetical protein
MAPSGFDSILDRSSSSATVLAAWSVALLAHPTMAFVSNNALVFGSNDTSSEMLKSTFRHS